MRKVTNCCDRCGKPIQYIGWTGIIKQRPKRLFIRKLYNGNPDGYSYSDYDEELCRDCVESFHKWWKPAPPSEIEAKLEQLTKEREEALACLKAIYVVSAKEKTEMSNAQYHDLLGEIDGILNKFN